ncbi:L,D-transpeptidase family protein [Parafilimonas terrae]|uniref:Murein L,D-transpeptidase YcbB/YkuD n=1 Tax=Parafilimonas terrae TaxID=1465490 RepID=A0A1I5TLP8_9BACT|nr:L,D-transpeptidase family protein [Parafilimonas terrae]SFP83975.1 Murein L,D-transpeptidase YcbB/YkuD [Parafilimonas terrae]
MLKFKFALGSFCIVLLFLYSCNSENKDKASKEKTVHKEMAPGSFNLNSGIKFDSNHIREFLDSMPLFKQFSKEFDTFYRANNYNYAWYDKNGLIETASALTSSLNEVKQEGVTADIPYKDTLEELLHTTDLRAPDITTELMLTGEYFYYAKKIYAGTLNGKADSINWYLPRKKLSYSTLLANNLSSGNIGEPRGDVIGLQYDGLKKALAHYRDIESKDDEIIIPAIKKSIKQKDSSAIVAIVRKRLIQLGYILAADSAGNIYDKNLAGVVRRLKDVYGLKQDSLLSNDLITELNIPAKKRIEQIMVNMERLRWIPEDTTVTKEFILVNIPEYTLVYYENAKPVWRCGVVVGTPMTKTVIFSGDMKYVVFSPYWNVPQSIINKEIKPGMARNKNYLAAHNMEWNGGHVRQKPGPRNSLGLVKFLFPNSNNIYLHDTPSKSLFNETNRAFSHGCIRVAKPRDLAIRVLRRNPEWTPEKIDAAMRAGKEKWVTLTQTIPVYIGYFTAYIDGNGEVNFRKDIYKNDDRLYNMLVQN